MKKAREQNRFAGIGDDAVRGRTGKGWKEWFRLLDGAGAKKMNHTEMAAYLHKKLKCPGWWNQMVAVGYEQARGLREKHQTATGFSCSVSKTLEAPLKDIYESWVDAKLRADWLGRQEFAIRKATPLKSVRITWVDGKTNLEVNFYSKGAKKSQVVVQHNKLADAREVERSKSFWSKALGALKEKLQA